MPLCVVADEPGSAIRIEADGAMPVVMALAGGRAKGTIPLLVVRPVHQIAWSLEGGQSAAGGSIPLVLRELGPAQRLVGHTSPQPPQLSGLFSEADTIIPVRIEPADLRTGSPAAWQALDALVLGAGHGLDERRMADLAACGIVLASPTAPSDGLPWRQAGGIWTLRAVSPFAPRGGENAAAFAPVDGWAAEWPSAFRWRIVLYGLMASIVFLALTLVRRRWSAALAPLAALAMVGGLLWWRSASWPPLQRGGDVIVHDGPLVQRDAWRYFASAQASPLRIEWRAPTWPIAPGLDHWRIARPRLLCGHDGVPLAIEAQLRPGVRLGAMSRALAAHGISPAAAVADDSPLMRLARRIYADPGVRIIGWHPPDDDSGLFAQDWGTLVIERSGRAEN
jgi:hypothetical protein